MTTVVSSYGANNANSYLDVSEAETYLQSKLAIDPWSKATDTEKTAAVMEATRAIDDQGWYGERFYYDQSLKFPRTIDGYPQGWTRTVVSSVFSVEYNRMRTRVKEACAEQALYLLRNRGRNLHRERMAEGIRSYSESVGGFSSSHNYGGTNLGLCPEAFARLRSYYQGPNLVRG